jgi:ribose/xylose/arabinose/galactoside ABC-type transport system permease subunit
VAFGLDSPEGNRMKTLRDRPIYVTVLILVLLVGFCAAQFPFVLSTRVLGNLLTDNAYIGVIALGMTVVIISGGIDLSVGSVLAFVGVLLGVLISQQELDPSAAFAVALVLGTAFGAFQGAAIHVLGAPAFIVTLAGMFLARGASFLLTQNSIPINHRLYGDLVGVGLPLPGGGQLTFPAIVMLAMLALTAILLRRTEFGTSIYALGGDRRAAELMGVRAGRTTVGIYAFSGFSAATGGILYSLYTGSAYPLAGVGLELDAIAASIIGGTLLTGGYGGVLGTFLGVLILGVIQLYITLDGTMSSWIAKIVTAALLLFSILAQRLLASKSDRSGH